MKSDMEKFEEAEEQAAKEQRTAEIVALAERLFVHSESDIGTADVCAIAAIKKARTFFQELDRMKVNGEI